MSLQTAKSSFRTFNHHATPLPPPPIHNHMFLRGKLSLDGEGSVRAPASPRCLVSWRPSGGWSLTFCSSGRWYVYRRTGAKVSMQLTAIAKRFLRWVVKKKPTGLWLDILKEAKSYEEWEEAAFQLDVLLGNDLWFARTSLISLNSSLIR